MIKNRMASLLSIDWFGFLTSRDTMAVSSFVCAFLLTMTGFKKSGIPAIYQLLFSSIMGLFVSFPMEYIGMIFNDNLKPVFPFLALASCIIYLR